MTDTPLSDATPRDGDRIAKYLREAMKLVK